METTFASPEEALAALSNPQDPAWGAAFAYLAGHPDTAALMIETFRDTLEQLGVEPSGNDPATGVPAFSLADVARAMGIPPEQLEQAVDHAAPDPER
jgi:hypothetical protein